MESPSRRYRAVTPLSSCARYSVAGPSLLASSRQTQTLSGQGLLQLVFHPVLKYALALELHVAHELRHHRSLLYMNQLHIIAGDTANATGLGAQVHLQEVFLHLERCEAALLRLMVPRIRQERIQRALRHQAERDLSTVQLILSASGSFQRPIQVYS